MARKKVIKTFVIPDLHCPFQDDKAVGLLIKTISDQKPEKIVFLGDLVDFYGLSRFDKDPKRREKTSIRHDLESWYEIANKIKKAAPNAQRFTVQGNHEDRLRRFIWSNAPILEDFVSLPDVMRFTDFGIRFMDKQFFMDGILFKHGQRVSQYGSYTAKREHSRHGCNGVSAHTHRLGFYPVRRINPTTLGDNIECWIEAGCLCSLNPDWTDYPDWHHGFVRLLRVEGRHSFQPQLVPILPGYKCWVGDTFYT